MTTKKSTIALSGNKPSLQTEVIAILQKGPKTFRQLSDAMILPGESTKPLSSALSILSSSGIAEKRDDGYIYLMNKTEVEKNTGSLPSDDDSTGPVMTPGLSKAEGVTESPPEVETPLESESAEGHHARQYEALLDILKAVQSVIGVETNSLIDLPMLVKEAIKHRHEPSKARQTTPRRPFSVTGLTGYHAQNGRVTLFVDRRMSARSITFHADKLSQLADIARGSSHV